MVETPKVSIIVPVYNVERYLGECLDSICEQTLGEIEIVCVDDGSTDGSSIILAEYANSDTRIKVITQKNGGLSAARNTGIEHSQGEYLLFVDSDDMIESNAAMNLYEYAKRHDLDVLCFGATSVFDSEGLQKRFQTDVINLQPLKMNLEEVCTGETLFSLLEQSGEYMPMAWLQLIRREHIIQTGLRFIPGILHEDEPFTFQNLLLARRTSRICDLLYKYRIRENSIMTKRITGERVRGCLVGYMAIQKFAQSTKLEQATSESAKRLISARAKSVYKLYNKLYEIEQKEFLDKLLPEEQEQFYKLQREQEFDKNEFERRIQGVSAGLTRADFSGVHLPDRIAIYGSGRLSRALYDKLQVKCEIECFIDPKAMDPYQGTPTLHPSAIDEVQTDTIIVTSVLDIEHVANRLLLLSNRKRNILFLHELVHYPIAEQVYNRETTELQRKQFEEEEVFPILHKKDADPNAVFLINTPEHGNLGDQAIAVAEQQFLEQNDIQYIELTDRQLEALSRHNKLDIMNGRAILIHGGGNMGTLWFHVETLQRKVVMANPDSKIVFLPNSIYYGDSDWEREEFKHSIEIYNSHKSLFIYMRECFSYEIAKPVYHNVGLVPDIVMMLNYSADRRRVRKGCILCLREDHEKTRATDDLEIFTQAKSLFGASVSRSDTVLPYKVPVSQRAIEVERKLEEFRGAELVITDRLHGMIFSAIAETPCIVLNSKSHKIKGGYQWLDHLEYIQFVKSVDEIPSVYKKIPKSSLKYDNSAMRPFFDGLQEKLIRLISLAGTD